MYKILTELLFHLNLKIFLFFSCWDTFRIQHFQKENNFITNVEFNNIFKIQINRS